MAEGCKSVEFYQLDCKKAGNWHLGLHIETKVQRPSPSKVTYYIATLFVSFGANVRAEGLIRKNLVRLRMETQFSISSILFNFCIFYNTFQPKTLNSHMNWVWTTMASRHSMNRP